MAGDWIPIDVNLPGKPEVALLSADLRTSTDEVVGLLVRFWIWCQSHTVDGFLAGLCPELIARVAHVSTKFLESLEKVGWLEVSDQGVRIPNFDRWFGGAAKRRLMEARKKRLQRESKAKQPSNNRLSRSCPDSVPILSRCDRDKNGTRGEESRGENLLNPSASAEGSSEPNGVRSEPPPADPPVFVYPTVGSKQTWGLTRQFLHTLQERYPNLDVLEECRKALAWTEANPQRRKTAQGMPRFLVNWLNKAVDGRCAPPTPALLIAKSEEAAAEAQRAKILAELRQAAKR